MYAHFYVRYPYIIVLNDHDFFNHKCIYFNDYFVPFKMDHHRFIIDHS